MAKRGRDDRLTGGSQDVKPQYMTLNTTVTPIAANVVIPFTFPLPVSRIGGQGKKKVRILEFLRAFPAIPQTLPVLPGPSGASQNLTKRFSMKIMTSIPPVSETNLSNPTVIAAFERTVCSSTNTVSGSPFVTTLFEEPGSGAWDFTDGNGNGMLIATDNIYVQITLTGVDPIPSPPIGSGVKILYRFYDADALEYAGIVMAQQQQSQVA